MNKKIYTKKKLILNIFKIVIYYMKIFFKLKFLECLNQILKKKIVETQGLKDFLVERLLCSGSGRAKNKSDFSSAPWKSLRRFQLLKRNFYYTYALFRAFLFSCFSAGCVYGFCFSAGILIVSFRAATSVRLIFEWCLN